MQGGEAVLQVLQAHRLVVALRLGSGVGLMQRPSAQLASRKMSVHVHLFKRALVAARRQFTNDLVGQAGQVVQWRGP